MKHIKSIYPFIILLLPILFCTSAFGESPFTIGGKVRDGLSNQPIPDAKLYLSIYSDKPSSREKLDYSARAVTDAEGKYQFLDIPESAVSVTQSPLVSARVNSQSGRPAKILVSAKGYIGTIRYAQLDSSAGKQATYDFALLQEGKEATVKGTVRDVVMKSPISGIPIELMLQESDILAGTYIQKDKENRKLTTDVNGAYTTRIPAKYVDRINNTSYWHTEIQSPEYEVVVTDYGATGVFSREETIKAEPETNIAVNQTDYYLVNKKAEGKLEGTFLDANNQPISKAKLRVEVALGGVKNVMSSGSG